MKKPNTATTHIGKLLLTSNKRVQTSHSSWTPPTSAAEQHSLHRLRSKLLPASPVTTDMAELFGLLFSDPMDRRWLRALEPRARAHLDRDWLIRLRPWLERRELFRFQRQPLARGVAAGLFCGLIPGPLQIPGTLLVCAWLRGNIVAGGVATFYTNPLTTVPLYALAFYLGALVMPGTQTLPAWSSVVPGGDFSVQALGTWMQALGTPLLVGLPTLGLVMAALGYATVQLLWLAPALQRKRRLARSR